MKFSEMIAAIGDDKVKIQNLDVCSITLDWSRKKGTTITFGTDMRLTSDGTEMLGLIVWVPRDIAAAIRAKGA